MNLKRTWQRLLVFGILMLTILSCTLPFNLMGRGEEVEPEIVAFPTTEMPPTASPTVTASLTPTPTETPQPSPTPTETPDPVLSLPEYVQEALLWETTFFDDFSDDSQEWPLGEYGYDYIEGDRYIANGTYYWTVEIIEERDSYSQMATWIPVWSYISDSFTSVKILLVDGPPETVYGFAFRQNRDGSYGFFIKDDTFQLVFDGRDAVIPIIDWTFSEAIKPGQMNELAVSTNGEHISLFINEEMVADITDSKSSYGGLYLTMNINEPYEQATVIVEEVLQKTWAASHYQEVLQWPLVFEDTFISNDNAWTTGSISNDYYNGQYDIADGKYSVEANAKQGFVHNQFPDELDELTDFYLTMDARLVEGTETAKYGVAFRMTDNDYYRLTFGLWNEYIAEVLVQARYQEQWFTIAGTAQSIESWDYETGDQIRLGVVAAGDHFIVLYNDSILFDFADSKIPAGRAGITIGLDEAGDSGKWEFSNFNIYSPTGAPLTQVPIVPTPTEETVARATPTTGASIGLAESVNPKDGANLVLVPAGEFLMGYAGSTADEDEGPEHLVYLDEFWLYETPVTSSQYRQCITAGACTGNLSRFPDDQLPAVRINWDQAVAYCDWAGGRLPTEAEWEKGARGTDGRLFPWGTQQPNCLLSNYQGCYNNQLTPVGQFPDGASPYGALDMLGLVWEWVSDWYGDDYYELSVNKNPPGPFAGSYRVQRGHSFESNLIYLRVTDRAYSDPSSTDYRKGFRCVLPDLP